MHTLCTVLANDPDGHRFLAEQLRQVLRLVDKRWQVLPSVEGGLIYVNDAEGRLHACFPADVRAYINRIASPALALNGHESGQGGSSS